MPHTAKCCWILSWHVCIRSSAVFSSALGDLLRVVVAHHKSWNCCFVCRLLFRRCWLLGQYGTAIQNFRFWPMSQSMDAITWVHVLHNPSRNFHLSKQALFQYLTLLKLGMHGAHPLSQHYSTFSSVFSQAAWTTWQCSGVGTGGGALVLLSWLNACHCTMYRVQCTGKRAHGYTECLWGNGEVGHALR